MPLRPRHGRMTQDRRFQPNASAGLWRAVSLEARLVGKPASDVRPGVLQQVIPGILIQPSGFFALIEAQRNGCGLFPAEAVTE